MFCFLFQLLLVPHAVKNSGSNNRVITLFSIRFCSSIVKRRFHEKEERKIHEYKRSQYLHLGKRVSLSKFFMLLKSMKKFPVDSLADCCTFPLRVLIIWKYIYIMGRQISSICVASWYFVLLLKDHDVQWQIQLRHHCVT